MSVVYTQPLPRPVITEGDVPASGELLVPRGAIITDSARDAARARGVNIREVAPEDAKQKPAPDRIVAIGSDHGGFQMKQRLKPVLSDLGLHAEDVGTADTQPADYPDIAEKVAVMVARGEAARGVIIDGAGIGSCIAANKVPGIRAALCYDKASARNSREHNDSNVLTLGGRLLTESVAEDVLRVWLTTPFGGGRHQGRVQKIAEIERRYSNWTPRS
ncbi:MAG TPA: ribose 5-phosphate isomerase B [Bryobacteraceae bacterium]|nr:ribose 5-phosphate isomerase B [Bryobacteraceae bacterium]